ncbi:MAG: helix-turn-helix domain-containing protein, partial [Candidatus Odinarchaeota archaeon]
MVVSLDETEKKVYAALLSKNTPLTANELAKITGLKPDEVTQAINKLLDMKILRTLQEKGFPDLYFPMPPSRLIQQTTSKSYSDIESALEGTTNLINSLKEGLSTSLDELHSGITEIPASIETILRDYNDIFRESSKSMIASKSDQYRNVLNEITKKGSQSLQDSRKKLQDSVAENYDVVIKGLSSSTSKLDSTTEQMNRLLIEYHNEFDGIIHDTVKHFEDALHGASSSISEVILNLEKSLTTNLRDSFSAQGTAQEAVLETVQKTLEEDSNTASSSLDEAKSRVKSLQKRLDDGITNSLTTLTQQLETLTEDKKEDIYQFLESRIKEIGKEITEKISVVQESSNTRMIKHLEKIDATKEQLSTFSTTTVPKTISGFSDALVRETKTIFQSLDVEIEKNLRLFEGMAFDFLENSRKDSREAVEDLLAQFSKLMNENIEFLESEFKTIEKSARDWKKTSVTVRNQLEELETAIVKRVEKYETSSKDLIDSHQNRIKEITGAINKNFETGIQEDVIKIREKLNTLFDSLKSGNVTRYESNVKALRGLQKDVVTTKDELISKFNENSEKHSETLKANLGTTLE